MAQEGKLRLNITNQHGEFSNDEVGIHIKHKDLGERRPINVAAYKVIEVTSMHTIPQGLYQLEVIALPFKVKSQKPIGRNPDKWDHRSGNRLRENRGRHATSFSKQN